jgi:hypothetical protein
MDPSAFDALTRSFQTAGSRRWLLRRLVASLPLLGALAVVGEEEVGAERPHERLARRTQQRNRKQRNRRRRNKNNNQNNNQNNNNQNNNNQNNNNQNNNNQNNNNQNRNKGKGQDPVCTVGQICGQPSTCGNGCFCLQSVEGTNFCIQFAANNCEPRCTSSTECAGGFCATAQCCSSGGQGQDGFTACIPAANVCAS